MSAPPPTRDERDRFVRQFALTRGRARPTADLALDTLVERRPGGRPNRPLDPEHRQIVELCADTVSIAEISAHIGVHLGIARVLVADLVTRGLVQVSAQRPSTSGPSLDELETLLHDLIDY